MCNPNKQTHKTNCLIQDQCRFIKLNTTHMFRDMCVGVSVCPVKWAEQASRPTPERVCTSSCLYTCVKATACSTRVWHTCSTAKARYLCVCTANSVSTSVHNALNHACVCVCAHAKKTAVIFRMVLDIFMLHWPLQACVCVCEKGRGVSGLVILCIWEGLRGAWGDKMNSKWKTMQKANPFLRICFIHRPSWGCRNSPAFFLCNRTKLCNRLEVSTHQLLLIWIHPDPICLISINR